ncbi:hypothetical protein [Williamsoniiplasma luminosum]|nr:hypothetical protein [Williamsoniiplasma luminosum]
MKIFFWTFFGISIAVLIAGIGIKWLNIQTSPIAEQGWTITDMFSPLKEKNWSLSAGFNFAWLQPENGYWKVSDMYWYNGADLSPTNLVFDMVANYAILIFSTVSIGIAFISFILFLFSKYNNSNSKQVQVIVNTQPNMSDTKEGYMQQHLNAEKTNSATVEAKTVQTNFGKMMHRIHDEKNSQDYLANLEAKYAEALRKQEEAERLERKKYEDALKNAAQEEERQKIIKLLADSVAKKQQMSTRERARLDGSESIDEPRSQLQKHANRMRSSIDEEHKLYNVNLRDMTKKELIKYMRQVANIN